MSTAIGVLLLAVGVMVVAAILLLILTPPAAPRPVRLPLPGGPLPACPSPVSLETALAVIADSNEYLRLDIKSDAGRGPVRAEVIAQGQPIPAPPVPFTAHLPRHLHPAAIAAEQASHTGMTGYLETLTDERLAELAAEHAASLAVLDAESAKAGVR